MREGGAPEPGGPRRGRASASSAEQPGLLEASAQRQDVGVLLANSEPDSGFQETTVLHNFETLLAFTFFFFFFYQQSWEKTERQTDG